MAPTNGLSDEELEALRALHEAGEAPLADEPIWDYLVLEGLVWIDRDAHPPRARLTPEGRARASAE
jgi:hypothetical protein